MIIPKEITLDLKDYEAGLKAAEEFHGHLCPGMFNGVKMALVAKRILGYDSFPSRDLMVIAEIDRCLTDAIMVITGARFGRRTMKFRDYGRFAATFCSIEKGKGVRISQKDGVYRAMEETMKERGIDPKKNRNEAGLVFFEYPVEKHFGMTVKDISWDENDLPGFPKIKVSCAGCGETVMDNRHLEVKGKTYCRPCTENL